MTTAKQTILILILTVFSLTACNNSARQNNIENTTLSDRISSSQTTDQKDTIVYEYTYLPIIDSNTSIKVSTVGVFHNDEVWESADKEKWFGLFKNKSNFYVAETKLKIKKVHDEIVDEENEDTGWEVQITNKDTAIILLEKVNYLTERNVDKVVLSKDKIFPNDTLNITYLGVEYKFFATGGKRIIQNDPEWYDVWNYKLYISATIDGLERKTLLVAQPNFDDQMIKILFAGDIDGDGILDLIIDTSRHYNSESPTIYLSKPSEKSEVVKPVGEHTIVGC